MGKTVIALLSVLISACDIAAYATVPARQIYRSFMPALEQTGAFAKIGIDTRCFLASESLIKDGYEPIWTGCGKYDFATYDRQVSDILKCSPDAKLVCIVDLNTPGWDRWGYIDSFNAISIACAAPEWIEKTTRWLKDFLAYSEKHHGDRIISYMLSAGGGLSEWFECDDGRSSRVKNVAWRAWQTKHGVKYGAACPHETDLATAKFDNLIYDPETEGEKIDYWRFHNDVIADAVLGYLKTTRESIAPGKEIGLFFGYSVKRGTVLASFGHADVERVFDSPDFDWVAAPGTYSDRAIGGGTGSQVVPMALQLRGKRFLHEIDHRPHDHADHPRFAMSRYAADDPRGLADDVAGYTREFAYALVKHGSLWWFDMRGGWFDAPAVMDRIAHLTKVFDRLGSDMSKSAAEVLMVLDPKSFVFLNEHDKKIDMLSSGMRKNLNHAAAAPFDIAYFDDLRKIDLKPYRLVFLPTQFLMTEERMRFVRENLLKDGRVVAWTFAPGVTDGKRLDRARVKELAGVEFATPGVTVTDRGGWKSVYAYRNELYTPEKIAELEKLAGVHFYLDGPEAPVFANERLLSIHLQKGGCRTVRLRTKAKEVVELVSGRVVARDADSFDYEFATPDTRIFEIKR